MKVVLQRVLESEVRIENESSEKIDRGILVLVGIHENDIEDESKIEKMVDKIINLRIYEDEKDKMNLSLKDIDGEVLIISNFTLYGDARKGTRPSYSQAARPELAEKYYDKFVECFKQKDVKKVATGKFGADMKVSLVNDGPVTIVYEL